MLFCIHAGTIGALQQVLGVDRQLGSLDDAQPAVLVRVFDDEVGVLQHFMVDRDQHALHRREQVDAAAFALDRAQLLSLAHPAVQVGQLDGINLAEQVSGESVDSNASVLVAFIHHPGVTGMEAVALRELRSRPASS